jgi:transcriptional regulator with XRE-family HTH domain
MGAIHSGAIVYIHFRFWVSMTRVQLFHEPLPFCCRLGIPLLIGKSAADIERGSVNTRLETILRICEAFHITPDEILTEETTELSQQQEELLQRLSTCSPQQRETALRLLSVYLQSLT